MTSPKSLVVDTHVHVWELPPIAPIGQTSPKPIKLPTEPGTAEELLADIDANGVDKAVLVQTSFSTWDNSYVADSAVQHPDRFASMGLVDPLAPDNASQIMYWMSERGMAGFRFHPMYYDEPVLVSKANAAMWDAIDELGAVVQFHMFPEHTPQIATIAQKHPSVPLIVDHLAYPQVAESPGFATHAPVIALSRFPNIYVKVSDVPRRSEEQFPYGDVIPYIKQVHEAFGADRMMWGTGYPGSLRERYGWPTLADELRLIRDGYDWLTTSEKDQLLGGTAMAVWGLH